MGQPLVLALDQGGHASRAVLLDETGRIVDQASVAVETRNPRPGFVEHDAEELVASLQSAIHQVCPAEPGVCLTAAGLATQRSSMVCWDRNSGEALSPVISWQDRRNAAWLERLQARGHMIRARTGLVLTPHYGASKMRWCLDHLPRVARAAADGHLAMGPLASFLLHRLLDERPLLADPANASRTQLWDIRTRDWSAELCKWFDVPSDVLPAAVTSRYAYGTLATPAGPVPLTVCTGDQSAVPFAAGRLDPACAYVNVGTGGFVQRAARGILPDAPRLLVSVVWSDAQVVDYMLEGTVNGAGSALDWFARETGADVGPTMAALDLADPSGIEPPLFLNGISGLGSPWWVSDFPSRFIGDGPFLASLAAIIESIAFLLTVNLEALREHGPEFAYVRLTGGFSRSGYFCRCLADITGLTVQPAEDPEATARGLSRLLTGDPGANIIPAPPAQVPAIEPRSNRPLSARYARWRAAMESAVP